jgi:hypothetical protein
MLRRRVKTLQNSNLIAGPFGRGVERWCGSLSVASRRMPSLELSPLLAAIREMTALRAQGRPLRAISDAMR